MLKCSTCKVQKPFSEYHKSSNGYLGIQSHCKACQIVHRQTHYASLKRVVFGHYGVSCKCCGETNQKFLSIDHINNDGAKQRKTFGLCSGVQFYCWIVKQGFPNDLQVLCMNCNCGKRYNGGVCPHQELKNV